MDRRQFLGSAAAAGALLALGDAGKALAAGGAPDLVAAKGGLPDALFDRAIQELGGMTAFVKKGHHSRELSGRPKPNGCTCAPRKP